MNAATQAATQKADPVSTATGAATGYRTPPHNMEAEMALLGALLVNNASYEQVQDVLQPEHFASPGHGHIYDAIGTLVGRGQLASPVTLKNYLDREPGVRELGGHGYITELANSVFTIVNAGDLAREIRDCFIRRSLIGIGTDVVNNAHEHRLDETAGQQIEQAESRLFDLAEHGLAHGGPQPFRVAVTTALEAADAAYRRDTPLVGLSSGFRDLDSKLGGLHKSDLIIVAGRPSMGKTAFATNLAFAAAQSAARAGGGPAETPEQAETPATPAMRETVAFFSLEMSSEQLASRILSDAAMVRSDAIRRGDVKEEEYNRIFAASQELYKLPLYIDDTPALPVEAIRSRARRLKRQQGLGMVVVDYLQLVSTTRSGRSDNRVQEVSEITRGLKAIARELHVPVVALSQLSRAPEQREDKRPLLSDLRESGSIEQDADVVMFLFREEYYLAREDGSQRDGETDEKFTKRQQRLEKCRHLAEVIIAKQRHGPTGTVTLHFDGEFTRFSDMVPDGRTAEPRY